jgi:hypothetical protein
MRGEAFALLICAEGGVDVEGMGDVGGDIILSQGQMWRRGEELLRKRRPRMGLMSWEGDLDSLEISTH